MRTWSFVLASSIALLGACSQAPRPLVAGTDACAVCRMSVADVRFGGEVQVRSGRIHTFDAIECLASFYLDARARDDVRGVWVADFTTARLLPVDSAQFVRSSTLHGPMGRSLMAYARGTPVVPAASAVLSWAQVVALVSSEQPLAPSATHSEHREETTALGSRTIVVDPAGSVPTISAALAAALPGSHVVVRPGTYREPTLRVTVPLTLDGGGAAVLDGDAARGLIVVAADDVTVRGFILRNTGTSYVDDRAALRVEEARRCRVENNRVADAFFAIYLARTSDCVVQNNTVSGGITRATERSQTLMGDGIHVWQSERVQLIGNRISGHRDGIYFEFVTGSDVQRNVSEENERYGLHFMFSDDCRYRDNAFRANAAGVAVMYTKRVHMLANRFEHNWGSNAYGLLFKDINDSEVLGNEFLTNSTALHLEGSNRNRIEGNLFSRNGWALRVLGNAQENEIMNNTFVSNSFDVTTNSRQNFSTFNHNFWDRYRGYDLNHDGIGDVPHAPVRLFALIVEQSPSALLLQRSVVVDMLDLAERVLPVLTPATLVDEHPLMRPAPAARGAP